MVCLLDFVESVAGWTACRTPRNSQSAAEFCPRIFPRVGRRDRTVSRLKPGGPVPRVRSEVWARWRSAGSACQWACDSAWSGIRKFAAREADTLTA